MFLGEGVEMVSVKSRSQGGVGSLERGVFYTPSTPYSIFYTRPIVIMMDELTASASEVLAAGLRDNCHAVLAGMVYGVWCMVRYKNIVRMFV